MTKFPTPGRRTCRPLRMLAAAALVAISTGASCDGSRGDALLAGDDAVTDSLSLTSPTFDHTVTSDDYRKWLAAEEALSRVSGFELADEIPLATATEDDVERAADALEENEPVRRAIESSGLSVEEYVATTVALEQAYAAAAPGPVRPDAPASTNMLLVDEHRADIERVRAASPLRSVDSRDWGDRSERRNNARGKDRDKERDKDKKKKKDKDKRKD